MFEQLWWREGYVSPFGGLFTQTTPISRIFLDTNPQIEMERENQSNIERERESAYVSLFVALCDTKNN